MATILIVDDDAKFTEFVARRFTTAGHQCRAELSAERALAAMEKASVDLMVLDIMLPGMSGFELCRRVRADVRKYMLPIVFVSAMNSQEEVEHALAQGADDYLSKPVQVETLLSHVEALLGSASPSQLTDAQTALPGSKSIRLEIQRAINAKKSFGLAYIEMTGLTRLVKVAGADSRMKALRHLARGIELCGESLEAEIFSVGHLGGGHFVCISDIGQMKPYCKRVLSLWKRHLPEFYTSIGQEKAYANATSDRPKGEVIPLVEVSFSITTHTPKRGTTLSALFEALAHVRQNALASGSNPICVDRRA